MLRCKAKPYTKGDEKYIFVSYSHKDSAKVFPVIEKLTQEGFRVWYDEGIDPGTEWPETIASYLSGASCVIAFISKNALASNECRREISFACRKKIGLISVFLEETELSPGMEMQLSAYQSVFQYTLPTQEEFYEKIIETEMLQKCRGEKPDPALTTTDPEQDLKNGDNGSGDGDEKEEKKGLAKKKRLIPAVCIIAVLAVAFGLIFGLGRMQLQIKDENVYHITLTANDKDENALEEDINTLRERLKVLCGGKKFSMDIDDESTIHLVLPKTVFGEENPEKVFKCYLSRCIRLYAVNYDKTSEHEEIQRSDIENIELLFGKIDGIHPEDYEIKTEEYPYIKITLTDETAKKIQKLGTHMVFAQDISFSSFYWYYTVPASGKNEYYIINNDKGNDFTKLLAHNLQHDPLHEAFTFNIDINDWVKWETPEKDEFGEKQCAYQDVQGKTITVVLTSRSEYTEGMLADDMKELKARLDILGEPYAFGKILEDNNYAHAAIKTTVTQMDDSIINLIGMSRHEDNIRLMANLTKEPVYEFRDQEQRFSGESTSYGFSVKVKKEKEILNALAKEAVASGSNKIYLMSGACALFESEVKSEFEEDSVVFSNFAFSGNRLSPSAERIVELINRVAGGYLHYDFQIEDIWFNADDHGETASRSDFLCSNDGFLEKLKKASGSPDVDTDDGSIKVYLQLPFDENLVNNSLKAIKKIYKAADFEQIPFHSLAFNLTDEAPGERTRITFNKHTRSVSSDEKGYIGISYLFINGQAEEYKTEFKKALSKDAFFAEKNPEDYSGWLSSP